VVIKKGFFWDITPCGTLKANGRLGVKYRPHPHGLISEQITSMKARGKLALNGLHGGMAQKRVSFTTAIV
jgi:hypothetical protein